MEPTAGIDAELSQSLQPDVALTMADANFSLDRWDDDGGNQWLRQTGETGDAQTGCSEHIQILAPSEADVPEILSLINGLAEYEHLQHLMAATEESLHAALFGSQPAAEVLLASYGGRCAGFALFYSTFCSVLGRRGIFLDNLYVKPELRGKGLGEALLKHLATLATERNCARLEWMVLNWNQPAIAFYRAEGADFMDGWTKCRMSEESIERMSRLP